MNNLEKLSIEGLEALLEKMPDNKDVEEALNYKRALKWCEDNKKLVIKLWKLKKKEEKKQKKEEKKQKKLDRKAYDEAYAEAKRVQKSELVLETNAVIRSLRNTDPATDDYDKILTNVKGLRNEVYRNEDRNVRVVADGVSKAVGAASGELVKGAVGTAKAMKILRFEDEKNIALFGDAAKGVGKEM